MSRAQHRSFCRTVGNVCRVKPLFSSLFVVNPSSSGGSSGGRRPDHRQSPPDELACSEGLVSPRSNLYIEKKMCINKTAERVYFIFVNVNLSSADSNLI